MYALHALLDDKRLQWIGPEPEQTRPVRVLVIFPSSFDDELVEPTRASKCPLCALGSWLEKPKQGVLLPYPD